MGWVREKKFVTANGCGDLEENGGNVLKLIVVMVQETPGIQANPAMEYSRAKANRLLPRERTGHSKHPLPTTQEKTLHMDITRWSTQKSD